MIKAKGSLQHTKLLLPCDQFSQLKKDLKSETDTRRAFAGTCWSFRRLFHEPNALYNLAHRKASFCLRNCVYRVPVTIAGGFFRQPVAFAALVRPTFDSAGKPVKLTSPTSRSCSRSSQTASISYPPRACSQTLPYPNQYRIPGLGIDRNAFAPH